MKTGAERTLLAGTVRHAERDAWRVDGAGFAAPAHGRRAIPDEVAVAFTYNGGTQAVMMATPADFEDFAIGFSLTEGMIRTPDEIERLEVLPDDVGTELRMWLPDSHARALVERRRHQAGPTGCGLCGIESLTEAMRVVPVVDSDMRFAPRDIMNATAAIAPLQALGHATRAVHAAAFWQRDAGIVALREDVGRHNALDKLIGAMARSGIARVSGVLVLTSRVSVELIQKAAVAGMPVLVAVSAPTALAVRTAEAAGITLIAVARDDGFEVFTHAWRLDASPVRSHDMRR